MIKISVDDREVKALLQKLQSRTSDLSPVMRNIASIMKASVEENFQQGGRPKWKPSQRAIKQGGQTLQKSGLLAKVSSSYTATSARVGSNLAYAAIHQFGGKAGKGHKVTIPARPFLVWSEELKNEIKETLNKYLAQSS